MYFDPTPLNMTTLLVVALAVWAMSSLYRGRYTSNLPLLFYAVAVTFSTSTDHSLNAYVLYAGLGLTLTLRFEFMNKGFTKFFAFLAGFAIAVAAVGLLDMVFGNGTMLS